MAQNLQVRPRQEQPGGQSREGTRSWTEAYQAFLRNPQEHISTKLLPLALFGIIPLSLLDDVLLPFIGIVDDIPTWFFTLFVIFRTWQRVRHYR